MVKEQNEIETIKEIYLQNYKFSKNIKRL